MRQALNEKTLLPIERNSIQVLVPESKFFEQISFVDPFFPGLPLSLDARLGREKNLATNMGGVLGWSTEIFETLESWFVGSPTHLAGSRGSVFRIVEPHHEFGIYAQPLVGTGINFMALPGYEPSDRAFAAVFAARACIALVVPEIFAEQLVAIAPRAFGERRPVRALKKGQPFFAGRTEPLATTLGPTLLAPLVAAKQAAEESATFPTAQEILTYAETASTSRAFLTIENDARLKSVEMGRFVRESVGVAVKVNSGEISELELRNYLENAISTVRHIVR
jgi:hypothetical protein